MFKVENRVVKPEPDVLLIPVFKKIWERDKSTKKERAMKELAYIEFCISPRPTNPYAEYPEETKEEKVATDLFGKKWEPDKAVKEAMSWYESWIDESSIGLRMYKANIKTINKLIRFLEGLNLNERTKAGNMIHEPKKVMGYTEESQKVLKGLKDLKEQIIAEDYSTTRFKGGNQISEFEK